MSSSRIEPMESSFVIQPGEVITQEKARLIATENESLRSEYRALQRRYVAKKADLKDKNAALQQKIDNLEEIISTNEADVAAYRTEIEAQL